jgi:metal-responsive CopG/Arc/MetJ family transcriptional regulator
MKKKASISVSEKLLKMIDKLPDHPPRSAVIEEALILYFKNRKAKQRDSSDLNILNANSKALNEEAFDVLDYQSE